MKRSSRITAAALGATLSLGAIGVGTAVLPAVAGAQSTDDAAEPQPAAESGHRRHPRLRRLVKAELELAADTIGIPVSDLREAVRDGQSISEVAEANGVGTQTVIDAVVGDLGSNLDQAVADGKITQERADAVKERLPERVADLVNRHRVVHPD
jgi:hypothetical protein